MESNTGEIGEVVLKKNTRISLIREIEKVLIREGIFIATRERADGKIGIVVSDLAQLKRILKRKEVMKE